MELGDLGIGVELDLEGIDSQLKQLEEFQAKPIAVQVIVDERILKQQLKRLSLTSVTVGVNIDTAQTEASLTRLKSQLQGVRSDIEALNGSLNGFSSSTRVVEQDLQQLTGKKRSVRIDIKTNKEEAARELQALALPEKEINVSLNPDLDDFRRKLSKLDTDSIDLRLGLDTSAVEKGLKELKTTELPVTLKPDSKQLLRSISRMKREIGMVELPTELVIVKRNRFGQQKVVSQSVEIDEKSLEKSISRSVERGFTKVKADRGGLMDALFSPLTNIVDGFFQGIGEKLGRNLGEGLEKSFQKRSKTSFSQIGEKAGQYIFVRGAQIGGAVSRRIGYAGGLKDVAKDIQYVGEAIDGVVDPKKFAKKYKKFEDNLVKTLEQVFVYKNPGAAGEQFEKTIQPFVDFSRQQTLRMGGVALRGVAQPFRLRKRVQLAASADEAREMSKGVQVDENEEIEKAKSISLITGGIDFQKGGQNTYFAENLVKRVLPGSYSVPVTNPYSNETDNLGEIFKLRQSIGKLMGMSDEQASKPMPLDRLMQVAIEKGFNPDAIKMAGQAMAYRERYPDKPINLAGTSGGSYIVEEAVAILERAGVENIKGIGITAPFAGLTQTASNKNFQANVGELDPLYLAMFGGKFVKAPEDNLVLKRTLAELPVRVPGLLAPSPVNKVVENAGTAHALLPFIAEPAFQKNIQQFLGKTIDPISPDFTGQTGIGNLDFLRIKNDERATIPRTFGAAFQDPATVQQIRANGAEGAEGYAFVNPDEPSWRRDYDFRSMMKAPSKKGKRTTGLGKEEADDYLDFLGQMDQGLVEFYESGGVVKQKLAAILPRATQLYPELATLQKRVLGQVSEQTRLLELPAQGNDTRTPKQRYQDQARLERLNKQFPEPQALLSPPKPPEPEPVDPEAEAKAARLAARRAERLAKLDARRAGEDPESPSAQVIDVTAQPVNNNEALSRLQQLQDVAAEIRPQPLKERLQEQYSVAGLREVGQRLNLTPEQYRAPKKALVETISQQDPKQVEALLSQLGDSVKLKQFKSGNKRSLPKLEHEAGIKKYLEDANAVIREGLQHVDRLQGQQRADLVKELEQRIQANIKAISKILAENDVTAETRRSFNGYRSNLESLQVAVNSKLQPTPPEPPEPPTDPLKAAEKVAEKVDDINLARVSPAGALARVVPTRDKLENIGGTVATKVGLVKDKQDFQVYLREVSTFFKELPKGVNVISGALQRYRANYDQAAERVRIAGEALAASGTIPKLAEGKKQITIVSGGFATMQGKHAEQNVVPYFKKYDTLPDHDLKPFENSGSDVDYDLFKQTGKYLVNAVPGRLARQVIRGYNPDSEAMATQAYAQKLVNPETPVNLFGVSGGAPVVSDAQQILKRLGVNVKAAAVGGATSGVINGRQQNKDEFRNFLSVFDPVSVFSLAGRDKKTSFVNDGGYGHFTGSYFKDSRKFKKGLREFYGSGESAQASAPKQIAAANDEAKAVDQISLARVAPVNLSGISAKLKSLFTKQKVDAERTYQLIVEEAAKLSNVTLKPGDIPKLTVDDARLKQLGGNAFYNIKENQILISQEVANLLGGTIKDIERGQKQIAAVVHEARHGLQLGFGSKKLSDVVSGEDESGVELATNVSPKNQELAQRSVDNANAQTGGALSQLAQVRIGALEGDAYEFEDNNTDSIIQSVSSQLKTQPKLQQPEAGTDAPKPGFIKSLASKPAQYLGAADEGLKQVGIDTVSIFDKLSRLTFDQLDSGLLSLDGVVQGLLKNSGLLIQGFVAFQAVSAGLGFISKLGEDALKASIRFDNLKTAMTFATGSSAAAGRELAFVRKQADELGVPLKSAEKGFTNLEAATRNTALEGQATKDIYLGVAQATTVLGLTNDDATRTLNALVQMAGKGSIQMEELRGQLEPIPGSFSLAARAMGMTEAELNKLVETGNLSSTEFLPKFARQMQIEYGGAAQGASQNVQSSLFRFQNSQQKLQENMGSTMKPYANAGLIAATATLNFSAEKGKALTAESEKLAFILGQVLSFIGRIGAEIGKIPGVAKALEVGLSAIFGVVALIGSAITFQIFAKLAALPVVAAAIKASLGLVGVAMKAAFAALPKFFAEFALIGGAIESVRTIFSIFLPSDLGNQFKDFADQAETQLGRISEAAKKTKKDVADSAPTPGQELPSEGFDLTLGVGDLLGLGAYKTDDILKASNRVQQEKLERLKTTNPEEYERSKNSAGFSPTTTVAELKHQKDIDQAGRFSDSVRNLSGQVLSNQLEDGSSVSGRLKKGQDLDLQINSLQSEKALLNSVANPDKNKVKSIDDQIKTLTAQRETELQPITEVQSSITGLRNNAKAAIEGINAKNLPAEKAAELKLPFELALVTLAQTEARMNSFTKNIKTSASVGRELATAFLDIANALEDAKVASEKLFNRNSSQINRDELQGFSADPLVAAKSNTKRSVEERDRLKRDFDSAQSGIDTQAEKLSSPDATALLGSIPIGSSGRAIDINSTLTEIEMARKELGDKDSNKKAVLEQLKAYREGANKQSGLEKELTAADLTVVRAEQTEKLAEIDLASADRDSATKGKQSKRQVDTIRQQLQLTKQRASLDTRKTGKAFFSAEDAAIADSELEEKNADVGVKTAQNQLTAASEAETNAQARMDDLNSLKGSIGGEEFIKRQRDLTNELNDLRVRNAEAAASVEDALARKTEASNRSIDARNLKILAGFELANKVAQSQIQLSQTNAETSVKQGFANGAVLLEEEAQAGALNEVQRQSVPKEIAQIETEIAQTKELEKNKVITKKKSIEDQLALNQRLADQNKKQVEVELERQKIVRDQAIKAKEFQNRTAQAEIQLSQTNAETAVKQGFANGTVREEAQAGALNEIQRQSVPKEIAQIKTEIAQTKELEQNKVITKRKSIEDQLTLNQRLSEQYKKQVDLEIERQKIVRDLAVKAIEDRMALAQLASNEQLAALDREKVAIVEIGQKALELESSLLKSKSDLQKSLDDLATSKLEIKVKVVEEAEKLLTTIKDSKANGRVKQVAKRQLSELGFSSTTKEADLADGKLKLEQQLAIQKQAALLREQSLQQQLLEIEIKKQEFAAKSAQFEAKKNVLLQEQAIIQAKGKLEKAEALAPGRERDRAIKEAQSELGIAEKGMGNAQAILGLADEQSAATGENAQRQRDALFNKQSNELNNFQSDRRAKLRSDELERAGVKGRQSSFGFRDAARQFNIGVPIAPPLPTAQRSSELSLQSFGRVDTSLAMAAASPSISAAGVSASSGGKVESYNADMVSMIGMKLDTLNANIERLANTPRAISLTSQNPVDDYAAFQNRGTANLLRG